MTDSPIENLAASIAHAAYEGFPDIEYEDMDWEKWHHMSPEEKKLNNRPIVKKTRKHTSRDITVVAMFPQVWSSTALGFGGLGGQAMTTAYTTILRSEQWPGYCVYFAGRFAYRVENPNHKFHEAIMNQCMVAVKEQSKYNV